MEESDVTSARSLARGGDNIEARGGRKIDRGMEALTFREIYFGLSFKDRFCPVYV